MKIKTILILLIICFLVSVAPKAEAGFGISPPRVWNDRLTQGSHFEQTITLTRSDPKSPIEIITEIDAPEIEDWITIDKGKKFVYPAGTQQYPIKIIIDVPVDAGYSIYYGKMTIKAAPVGTGGSQVTVALGAVVDFKLRVSGEKFSDFKTRGVSIPNIEEGWPIKFVVSLENIGNVKTRPSKVHLDVFDDNYRRKIKSGDITRMSWVESFKVGASQGEMPISLKVGQYWGSYEVYKDDEVILKDRIRFTVLPAGTIIPPPLWTRIKNFITASPLRLVIFTFLGTLIIVSMFFGGIVVLKRRKNKRKRKLEESGKAKNN